MKRDRRHNPVLMDEVLAVLDPRPGHTAVDCTLGLGGHSAELLRRILPGGRLIALDLDLANMAIARERLTRISRHGQQRGEFKLVHSNYADLPAVLGSDGIPNQVDCLLADLGVASTQIDDPSRGFSYRRPGPLDMRMDPARGQPASTLVNTLSEAALAEALLDYGDETDAPAIAALIVERRRQEPITTTEQLTAIICQARRFTLERAAGAKLHPAARSFQALRILVNRELESLDRLLAALPDCLSPGGIAAVISFHSGEDRRIKLSLKQGHQRGVFDEISPEPITASSDEAGRNPRARSAKLRWARRASPAPRPVDAAG